MMLEWKKGDKVSKGSKETVRGREGGEDANDHSLPDSEQHVQTTEDHLRYAQ